MDRERLEKIKGSTYQDEAGWIHLPSLSDALWLISKLEEAWAENDRLTKFFYKMRLAITRDGSASDTVSRVESVLEEVYQKEPPHEA